MNTPGTKQIIMNPSFEDCIYEEMKPNVAFPVKRQIIFREEIGQGYAKDEDSWKQQNEHGSYSSSGKVQRNGSYRALLALVFLLCLLSIAAIVLNLLMFLGKISYKCRCSDDKLGSTSTRTQEARSSANTEFLAKMKLLEQNVTYLHQTLETRSERLMELEKSYKVLRAENEIFRNLMVNSSHFELLERRFNKLEGNYKHFTDTFQELSANVTVCRSVADQTAKKLENFQIKTNNSFSILNRADSKIDKKTNNLQLLLDEFNTTMSRKLNQLHSYLTTVNSMSNRTERTVNAFKNSTEDSLASVYASLRSIVQDANKTREDLWRSILNTSNELKQERDRLDQEDADLRTLLTGTNITLFAKVENVSKLQGPVGPPGFNGSQGSIGPSGPRGFNGTQGIQGSIGPRGFNGSQGPAGPAGPQGPEGAGNFSLCQYMTTEETLSQTPIASNIHNAPVQVIQAEPAGKRIVGVSCSTDIAQMYLVSSSVNPSNGVRFYYCECKGHYGTGTDVVKCIMNYWLCPLTT
ncbi:collectin-12-like isoform X5 [Montipora capricornis]|uniref:collectin-12-like isoform X5 n=1 Tax=Montipora capricornis TaxID=246305 RepID=UPI0035F187C0